MAGFWKSLGQLLLKGAKYAAENPEKVKVAVKVVKAVRK